MIPGNIVATLLAFVNSSPSQITDAFFNYISLLINGEQFQNTLSYLDDAGSSNTATGAVGAARNDNFSPFQGDGYYSTSFNGTPDYLSVAHNASMQFGSGDFTMECWINTTASTQYMTISTRTIATNNWEWSWMINHVAAGAGDVAFYLGAYSTGTPLLITSGARVNDGAWHHLALTRSGSNWAIFIDGVKRASTTNATAVTPITTPTLVGYDTTFTGRAWVGYISSFRMVKGTAVYTNSFTPITSPLTAITNTSLLTCNSSTLVDKSGNNNAITLVGTPKVSYAQPVTGSGVVSSIYIPTGTSHYFSYASNAAFGFGTGDFTVELWVNCAFNAAVQEFIDARTADNAQPFVLGISGTGLARTYDGTTVRTGGQLNASTWNHVAWVRASNVNTIYVNGVAGHTWTASQDFGSSRPFKIGNNIGPTSEPFTGYMSNLRVVKGTAIYSGTFTPSTSPLAAITGTTLLTFQGSVLDASTSALTPTITGGPGAELLSPFSNNITLPASYGSAGFNGSADNLLANSNTAFNLGTGDFTVECWVYQNGTPAAYNSIIDARTAASFSTWIMGIYNVSSVSRLDFVYGASRITATTTSIPNYQWTHIAYVRTSGVIKLFVNGVQDATTVSYASAINCNSTTPYIARNVDGNFFNGYISNLRVVVGSAVYTTTFTPPTSPLVAVANTTYLALQNTGPGSNSGIVDNGPLDFPLARVGSPSQGTFSPFSQNGWSNYFNGTTDYISAPANATAFSIGTSDFTIECWVLPLAYGGSVVGGSMFQANTGSQTGYSLNLGETSTRCRFISKGSGAWADNVVASVGPALGVWSHVAVVRSGTSLTIYVNGVSRGTATIAAGFSLAGATTNATIGYFSDGGTTRFLNGYVSNVRVVKSALYTTAFTPPTSPLTAIANTTFLSSQNSRFIDNGPNALTLSTTGSPSAQATSPFESNVEWSPSVHGGSIYFNGSSDYVTTSVVNQALNVGSNTSWTIEGWYYPLSYSATNNAILRLGAAVSTDKIVLATIGTAGTLTYLLNGTSTISGQAGKLNTWNHYALVKNGTTTTLYLNGVSVGSVSTGGPTSSAKIATYGLDTDGTAYFAGYQTNMRIINGVALYNGTFTLPTAPLPVLPYTQLLIGGSNNTVRDALGKLDVITSGSSAISASNKKYGTYSVKFNGSTDYLTVPLNASNATTFTFIGDFTIEAWVYRSAANYFCLMDARASATYSDYVFGITTSGQMEIVSAGGAGLHYVSTETVPLTTWTHVVFQRASGVLKAYIGGVPCAASVTYATTMTPANTSIRIGGTIDPSYAAGFMDELRVTRGTARYSGTFTPPTASFPIK